MFLCPCEALSISKIASVISNTSIPVKQAANDSSTVGKKSKLMMDIL